MTAFVIIAACLICLDRMFFKGQLLSIFIDGMKGFRRRKNRPSAMPNKEPADASEPPSLVVTKRYANGHKRSAAAKPIAAKQSVAEDAIFARPASPEPPQMKSWSDLVDRPAIGEDGEPVDPEEPTIALAALPAIGSALHDPEVVSLLGTLEAGERIVTDDATQEEMRAIENFDMRAYV